MRSDRVVLAVVAAGVVALALTAALRETRLALTLGVAAGAPVAPLQPDQVACQRPIDVPSGGDFETVVARVGTYAHPGSRLVVTVEDERGGGVLAGGSLAGGYSDIGRRPEQRIKLDRTVRAERIAVCIRNSGRRRVAVYGNIDLAARSSSAYVDGSPVGVDLSLDFEREPRTIAGMVPLMFERAALFRFPGSGAWTYLGLAILLAVAGPWFLLRSVRSAARASDHETSSRAP